jgi:hypothetical protein
MALPVYPVELPPPTRDTYQIGFGDGRFKSKNDAGPGNVRGRFSSTVHTVPFSTFLDATQVGRFRYFYFEETKEGKLPFLIPDHSGDGYMWLDENEVPVLDENGVPILMTETWLVLFDSLPVIKPRDIYWTATFSLSVMP